MVYCTVSLELVNQLDLTGKVKIDCLYTLPRLNDPCFLAARVTVLSKEANCIFYLR